MIIKELDKELNKEYYEFCDKHDSCVNCKYLVTFPCQMLFGYEKGLEVAIDLFQNWLTTQIVGIDTNTKEILVVKGDRWKLAINEFKEYIKNDYRL